MTTLRRGGEILVEALLRHGANRAFCVPGESYLAVLDALYDCRDRLTLHVCRHDGGAAYMAEAYGKLTGRPGLCFVTRGPGATNAAIAVHVARQDSTPMILFVGQVPRRHLGFEAFQEVDYAAFFGPIAKHVEQVDDASDIAEAVRRGFRLATTGRPGPVVIALPEDVLREEAQADDLVPAVPEPPRAPAPDALAAIRDALARARRPMVMIGGSVWTDPARAD
ncbi:MAG: thiamine pyrophosphate-binding protein, partial [Alphaproteobacteria bacterium]